MLKLYQLLILQLCILLVLSSEEGDEEKEKPHLVEDLFDGLYDKDIYSGYLKTDVEGNELFYVFTPSQRTPAEDPLILWLNGGPGCSSLYGMLTEIGPVLFDKESQQFKLNEYSWNKNASVIYIESPAGVGFSKINDSAFFFNDTIQAISLNIALQNFFNLFPDFQNNDFYITGESYAGIYIPYLVKEIDKYNKESVYTNSLIINLKGFLIGNPYTMEITDFEDSMVEEGFGHALISNRLFLKYLKTCPHLPQKEIIIPGYEDPEDYKFEPIMNDFIFPVKNVTKQCNEVRKEIQKLYDGINLYGILNECPKNLSQMDTNYKNIDYEDSLKHSFKHNFIRMMRKQNLLKQLERNFLFTENNEGNDDQSEELVYADDIFAPSCLDDMHVSDFLNDNTTKRKLGVDESIVHYQCTPLYYLWGESINFYIEDIYNLTSEGFKPWIFSGTEDIAVATLGTLRWINYINYTVDEEWKPWNVDGQDVGMEQNYTSGLRFLTVKGCGHMVPEDNPKVAKALLDKFLSDEK